MCVCMYGYIYIYIHNHPEAAFGYVIAEQNQIYPAMSGHNTMCVATLGWFSRPFRSFSVSCFSYDHFTILSIYSLFNYSV